MYMYLSYMYMLSLVRNMTLEHYAKNAGIGICSILPYHLCQDYGNTRKFPVCSLL